MYQGFLSARNHDEKTTQVAIIDMSITSILGQVGRRPGGLRQSDTWIPGRPPDGDGVFLGNPKNSVWEDWGILGNPLPLDSPLNNPIIGGWKCYQPGKSTSSVTLWGWWKRDPPSWTGTFGDTPAWSIPLEHSQTTPKLKKNSFINCWWFGSGVCSCINW